MKKSILIFLFLFIVHSTLNTEYCLGQWVQVYNGIGSNNSVRSLTASGPYIFAGTSQLGVFRSSNNGEYWIQTSLNNHDVYSLAANGPNIFAVTGGVWLSKNYGDNWTLCPLYSDFPVICIAVSSSYIYAGVDRWDFSSNYTYGGGIYRSTNNGQNWIKIGFDNKPVSTLAASGSYVFAGVASQSCWTHRSPNYGENWKCSLSSNFPISFAISGSNIFAGTENGVYHSTNNGIDWSQTSLINQVIYSITISGNNIFAGTFQNGVYLSTNNGANWVMWNTGFYSNTKVVALIIANGYVFAGKEFQSVWRRPISDIVESKNISSIIPGEFELFQNYPNPFNPTTKIKFDVPLANGIGEGLGVRLVIYDLLGREVATLVNESAAGGLKPGSYEVEWNACNYPSGVYFYKLITNDFTDVKKMVLLK